MLAGAKEAPQALGAERGDDARENGPSMSETELRRAILEAVNLCGCVVWVTASGTAAGGRRRLAPKGTPDLTGYRIRDGRFIGIEVKLPGGKLSVEQQTTITAMGRSNCLCGVARSVADAIRIVEAEGPELLRIKDARKAAILAGMTKPLDTIDAWRARNWGQPGACPCGDPIILADTEEWKMPRCFDCWMDISSSRWLAAICRYAASGVQARTDTANAVAILEEALREHAAAKDLTG